MKSRAVRLALLSVFVAVSGVTAYFFWVGESRFQTEIEAGRSFDERAGAAARDVLELRAAQQAYVAAGQGEDFWASKVSAGTAGLRETLTALRMKAASLPAESALDNALSALQDFEQMDRRARDYARAGQKLVASDLIFADGFELSAAIAASLDQARTAEREVHDGAIRPDRRRELAAAAGTGLLALLVIGLLVPRVQTPGVETTEPQSGTLSLTPLPAAKEIDTLDLGRALDASWSSTRTPAGLPGLDLPSIASLCSELAKVTDTRALPAILERAAAVLDASGIVLWIADPDGRELSPIVTHGYSPKVVSRLGTILRETENATASAFRTALLQTVRADAVSNGAIAAPLVTPTGCVGVMAAEVRHDGEQDSAKLAAASIIAAQLATLVGPPSARAQARTQASGT